MAAGEDVGVLVARLVADSEGLRRDMAKAQQSLATNTAKMNRHLEKTNRRVKTISSSFKGMRLAVSGAALMMAGRFVKSQLDAVAALQDTASAIGFQTESLQTLRHAALQFGQSQRTVDMALQRFSRRVGEAAQGQGEFLKTAQAMNLQLVDAEGNMRSNEAIMADFADGLRGAASEQERLAMAFKAFDSEGARPMIMLLSEGSDGLREFQREARNLGVVMDEETIAKARNASIQFNVLANVMRTQTQVAISENSDAWLTFGRNASWAFQQALKGAGWLLERLQNLGVAISHLISGDTEGAGIAIAGGFNPGGKFGPPPTGAGGGAASPGAFPAPGSAGGGGSVSRGGGTGRGVSFLNFDFIQSIEAGWRGAIRGIGGEWANHYNLLEQLGRQHLAAESARAESRKEIEADMQSQIQGLRMGAFGNAVGLLSALGAKHKGAAIASLAIQKGLGIAEVLIQSKVASMRALAELGPIAGPPVAASFTALGRLNAGLIAATGLVQASQISAGTAGLGTVSQPVFTQSLGGQTPTGQALTGGASSQQAVQVIFQGPFLGWNDQTERAVVSALQTAINDRDQVIIRGESRQAEEIRRASS